MPLKHLSKFICSLNTLLINSEIELILKWSQNCVLTEIATREFNPVEDGPPALNEVPAINAPSD